MPTGDPEEWTAADRARVDRLQVLLPGLVSRRVPFRLVEPGPVGGVARVRMADGTAFLAVSASPAALSRVLRALDTKHAVVVGSWERSAGGLSLFLSGVPGRHPVTLLLVGPDQPD
ncbi:hypothetical protein [Ornithinimicrobium avium]|uniref:Uncharacterized protein n=1 Tax=Ornithinimicrobium avium TaxID=2283195 RepID=A0A345NMG1_9MICO|nr:hypothetical protein [Ornithinimicrobium avium]AXH96219.1 hypothetical protein DV701_08830 [Ornithinimicrobium avium]